MRFNLKNHNLIKSKIAGLDLNERKGSAQRYIPPHLRQGGEPNDSSKYNDNNYQGASNNVRESYSSNRGTDRDYNNRWVYILFNIFAIVNDLHADVRIPVYTDSDSLS